LTDGVEWGFWLVATVWWVVELGLSPIELVLMGTVLELSVLLAETPTGVVADLMSRKRSIIIAQIVMGIGFIWAVASTNYLVLLPAQVIFGVGWTFRSGADVAWVTDELKGRGEVTDDDIERLLLRKHRFGIAVSIVMVIVAMAFGTLTSVRWAGVLMGVLQMSLGVYFAVAMREDHFTPGRENDQGFFDTLRNGLAVVRATSRLRVLVVVILLLDMGAEAFDRLGYKHLLDVADVDDGSLAVLGLLFIALALAGLLVNAASAHWLRTGKGVARLAFALLVVAALGGLLAAVTNIVLVIALGYMFQDSVREALWPVLEGWANRDAPSEVRATVHSLMGQATSVGELIGGIGLGLLAEATSIRLTLVVGAGFFAASALSATRGIDRGETVGRAFET
jgi:DHA3 family tetracycline resistance protein-like MFS transporter